MNRRAFLQLLSAGAASLAVPDGGAWRFLASETPTFAPDAITAPVMPNVRNLMTLTRGIVWKLGRLQTEANHRPFLVGSRRNYRLGDSIADVPLTEHAMVTMLEPNLTCAQDEIYDRWVTPIASAMFARLQDDGGNVFGPLALPVNMSSITSACRVVDNRSGVAVRALLARHASVDGEGYAPLRFRCAVW